MIQFGVMGRTYWVIGLFSALDDVTIMGNARLPGQGWYLYHNYFFIPKNRFSFSTKFNPIFFLSSFFSSFSLACASSRWTFPWPPRYPFNIKLLALPFCPQHETKSTLHKRWKRWTTYTNMKIPSSMLRRSPDNSRLWDNLCIVWDWGCGWDIRRGYISCSAALSLYEMVHSLYTEGKEETYTSGIRPITLIAVGTFADDAGVDVSVHLGVMVNGLSRR